MSLQSVQMIFNFQPQTSPAIMASTLRMQAGILEGLNPVEAASKKNTKQALPTPSESVKPNKGKKAVSEVDIDDDTYMADSDDPTGDEDGPDQEDMYASGTDEVEKLTKDKLITTIKDFVNSHKTVEIGRTKIAKMLAKYKVKSVHDLAEKHYAAVYEAVGGQ